MAAELTRPDLTPLLRPRSVAVLGASGRAGSFGHRLLSSLAGWSFPGAIFPVNPGYETLDGRACYPNLAALPEIPDCVAFAVSDDRIEQALEEAAAAGVRAAMIFGRGYEPPAPGRMTLPERLEQSREMPEWRCAATTAWAMSAWRSGCAWPPMRRRSTTSQAASA